VLGEKFLGENDGYEMYIWQDSRCK